MRSEAGTRAAGLLHALAGKAAALATLVAVLLLAVSHVEIDHASRLAVASGQQAVLVTSAPCSSAALGHAGSGAAECSAPCAAPLPAALGSWGAIAQWSPSVRSPCLGLDGVHVGFATPPPRIA
ncbi:hypothetical protein [Chenggangzhangella methanolivorans]|uniref:Uncharacterized protein n=1 Tax=Chenggangzhangella methanolivorans TaxID=1437009 RepID=A0A9E6RC01_9HYPH|nr:hypothetical protein [Chenggangzhangella methanolivorans]QZO00519.1 hypothetical protein K6K41_01940 [Chenggangzhangella methanolivorans]